MDKVLFTIKGAASYLSVSRSTIYNMFEKGQIRSMHIGKRRLIPRGDLDAFITQQLEKELPAQ